MRYLDSAHVCAGVYCPPEPKYEDFVRISKVGMAALSGLMHSGDEPCADSCISCL